MEPTVVVPDAQYPSTRLNENHYHSQPKHGPATASSSPGAQALPTPPGPAVLERYHHELLSFLARQVDDRDTAADLAQESFARVLAAQASGKAITDARALLYRTARNLVTDQYRRATVRRHENVDTLADDELPRAPLHLHPDEALASRQVIEAYLATIAELPERCRQVFILSVFENLTYGQIAREMGISVSMVEKHVVRAMVACRQCARRLNEGNGEAGNPLSVQG